MRFILALLTKKVTAKFKDSVVSVRFKESKIKAVFKNVVNKTKM